MTLEHVLEFPPSSEERCLAQTPSMLWPVTPFAENDRLQTPTNSWPATPLGERDCPQTPSMLWPPTPMAWPAMTQGVRVPSPKQDVTGPSVPPLRWSAVADGAETLKA